MLAIACYVSRFGGLRLSEQGPAAWKTFGASLAKSGPATFPKRWPNSSYGRRSFKLNRDKRLAKNENDGL